MEFSRIALAEAGAIRFFGPMPFFIKAPQGSPAGPTPKPEAGWLAFLDNAPAMIWVSDPRGRLIYINNNWRKATAMVIADNQADAVWEVVHPVDRGRLAEAATAFTGESISYEYRLRQADGSFRWVQENVRIWRDEHGRMLGDIGSATAGMIVSVARPRKRKITTTTSTKAISRVSLTSSTEARIVAARS